MKNLDLSTLPAKKRKQIVSCLRAGIQLLYFLFLPSVFTAAFNGVKYIFTQLGQGEKIEMTAFVSALLLVCAFTIVFGRFFCGFACAFGSLGDAMHAIYGIICKKRKKKPRRIKPELAKKLALLENQGTTAKTGTAGNAAKETTTDNGPQINEMQDKLKTAVLKGNRNGIVKITKEALESGEKPAELLNQVLLPAINQVGEFFDQGKYFLPQLIASAEAMKNSIEVLEPLLQTGGTGEEMPVVVIATVEGDIHDIGKNLVALMLKNHGFHVIDLGKDVPQAKILESAKEHHAEFIALSALMTTTMQRMREIVAAAKEEGITAKIIIGGAVITQEYADEIGADGYSKDAADAVKLAKSLM